MRPLAPEEWEPFVVRAKAFYEADMTAAGIDPALARTKAEDDFAALLPDGASTPGQLIYAIDDGGLAGYLWLAERRGELGHNLFVYAVEVDEERRGRGLGRLAMRFAEDEARRRGIPRVALNVFGGNEIARRLYSSLGYRETAVHMEKPV